MALNGGWCLWVVSFALVVSNRVLQAPKRTPRGQVATKAAPAATASKSKKVNARPFDVTR